MYGVRVYVSVWCVSVSVCEHVCVSVCDVAREWLVSECMRCVVQV